MNNVFETYCSPEVSNRLQQRGFDCDCTRWYNDDGITSSPTSLPAPTQSLAFEWLRVNFGFHIHADILFDKYYAYIQGATGNPICIWKEITDIHPRKPSRSQ